MCVQRDPNRTLARIGRAGIDLRRWDAIKLAMEYEILRASSPMEE
jgi:hypothetical protein